MSLLIQYREFLPLLNHFVADNRSADGRPNSIRPAWFFRPIHRQFYAWPRRSGFLALPCLWILYVRQGYHAVPCCHYIVGCAMKLLQAETKSGRARAHAPGAAWLEEQPWRQHLIADNISGRGGGVHNLPFSKTLYEGVSLNMGLCATFEILVILSKG